MSDPIRVIFVCYGNRCRSPAAEYYAKKYAADHGLDGIFHFRSAGLNSMYESAEPDTINILWEEEGIDMSGFQSNNLSEKMIRGADYIVTMDGARRDFLRASAGAFSPEFADKVFTLKELARRGPDPDGSIADPYEENVELYRKILHEIKEHVHWAIEEIIARE